MTDPRIPPPPPDARWCGMYSEICDIWDEHGIPDDQSTVDEAARLVMVLWRHHKLTVACLDDLMRTLDD